MAATSTAARAAVPAATAAEIKPQLTSPGIQVSVIDSKHAAPAAAAGANGSSGIATVTSQYPKIIYLADQSFDGGCFDYKSAAIQATPLPPHPAVFTLPLDNENFNVHHGIWPKLSLGISGKDASIKNQALTCLTGLIRRPNAVQYALHHGFAGHLFTHCLTDGANDATCRRLATAALISIGQHRNGRETLLGPAPKPGDTKSKPAAAAANTTTAVPASGGSETATVNNGGNGFGAPLLNLLSDSDLEVRQNTYAVWLHLTRDLRGVNTLIGLGGIDVLINKAGDESAQTLKAASLDVLANCLIHESGFAAALASGVVLTLTRLLRDPALSSSVLASACRCVAFTAVPLPGKKYCVISGCVPLIIAQLADMDPRVREHATHALMTLTIDLKAKTEALSASAVPLLLQLIDRASESDIVRAYSLNALANISEADHKSSPIADPQTRKRMEQCALSSHPLVREAAKAVIVVLDKL